ncbi:PAS domain-containing sensor histidine kinase [Clostridium scatologenes]|uniref:histidine kinase n=1 Tax=Clostridium scatologenes TaxID=1548 RepID=A0A0E3M9X7_CLOSL|nr:PAS domain-containing sensor histidine kinase [Clostridium scatologenes]AKA70069.1 PAS/PAC sensor signal transduction histidine kinase [Clostridium scatologenes]
MDSIDKNRQENIYNIVSIVKLVSLCFCGIVIYNGFFMKNQNLVNENCFYIVELGLLICLMFLIYWGWSFFSIRIFKSKYIKRMQIIENMVFIIIFSFSIFLSNSYTSQYKFLFLFLIITSTLQFGMKYGMSIALISSAIILIMDLVHGPSNGVNLYFENDLILVGVFILTAWPLGHYVKIEKENLKQKDMQLKTLNSKLSKQEKHRKYVEKMLLNNEACYNLLIENSRDAIFVHRDDKVIFTNESAVKLVGFTKTEDLNEKSIFDFTTDDEKNNVKNKFKQIYDKEITRLVFEEKVMKSNGDIIIVKNTSTYFIYEGKQTILSILSDITSEKQVEKLEKDVEENIKLLNETREFNKMITEFFSNISHELKTPLNVIFSAVQVLNLYINKNQGENIEKQHKYLKVVKQNCYRLLKLINNLLDITRVDSGFLKLHAGRYNIVSVVEDITLSVVSYVESKGINLIFDTDVEEKVMNFDADKIERIILNLLSNSIKFTNSGGKIYVNMNDLGNSIIISVKDTGVGIPEDKMKMIFERFGQVDKTLRRNSEGTGIGLCLVKSFVEMHGGTIEVKSKLGEGSEFIIKLPEIITEQEPSEENSMYETNIERINIEFSDIYSQST